MTWELESRPQHAMRKTRQWLREAWDLTWGRTWMAALWRAGAKVWRNAREAQQRDRLKALGGPDAKSSAAMPSRLDATLKS